MSLCVRSVHSVLLDGPYRFAVGEVLAVHRRSVTVRIEVPASLVSGARELVTFAVPELGNGPLGVLVAGDEAGLTASLTTGLTAGLAAGVPWPPVDLAVGAPVIATPAGWQVGGHEIVLDARAVAWTPPALGAASAAARAGWPAAAAAVAAGLADTAGGAAAALGLCPSDAVLGAFAVRTRAHLGTGAAVLRDALERRDAAALGVAVQRLAGVGGGLTPAGDDLLCGLYTVLARAGEPMAHGLRPALVTATDATTPVAAHMLRWAVRGVVNQHLLALAVAAAAGDAAAVQAALPAALAHGASSGADFAAGVWLGLVTMGPDR